MPKDRNPSTKCAMKNDGVYGKNFCILLLSFYGIAFSVRSSKLLFSISVIGTYQKTLSLVMTPVSSLPL